MFIYNSNYRLFLYVRHIGFLRDDCQPEFTDIEFKNFINYYNLNCTLEVYFEIYNKFKDDGEFEYFYLKTQGLNFFKYMVGLPKGRYYISYCNK